MLLLAACGREGFGLSVWLDRSLPTLAAVAAPPPTFTPLAVTLPATPAPLVTAVATATPFASPTPVPRATAVFPTATPSATPDPYAGLTIADLAARAYGAGELRIVETLEENTAFSRYLVAYPSDGLTVYGFMNVPRGAGPLPVVLVLHGYVDPQQYATLAYTTRYADDLARAGFLVLHPNYRNHPPSDAGPDRFRVGYAVDALNLIALVQALAGRPGPLAAADGEDINLWGHSMGGGIALRVITVNPAVRRAVLYAAMSGDEYLNYARILRWSGGAVGQAELDTPPAEMARIAPIHHLARIETAVAVHHGMNDGQVPPAWSADLCAQLRALGKDVRCYIYDDQPHTFTGEGDDLFRQRVRTFLRGD
jgi:uncharacterized protein